MFKWFLIEHDLHIAVPRRIPFTGIWAIRRRFHGTREEMFVAEDLSA